MLEIRSEKQEKAHVVTPIGEVDMNTSGSLRKVLQKIVKAKEPFIVIDLNQVEYIDSSGLATIIECFQQIGQYSGKLKLVVNQQNILDVFKLARLDQIFDMYESLEKAFE